MTNQSPAEALRQQVIEAVTPYAFGDDGHLTALSDKDCYQWIDAIVKLVTAYAATVEREAASRELKQLVADTLIPENVGGHFIHDEVKEFAKQQREFINDRLAALQGPIQDDSNTSEEASSTQ